MGSACRRVKGHVERDDRKVLHHPVLDLMIHLQPLARVPLLPRSSDLPVALAVPGDIGTRREPLRRVEGRQHLMGPCPATCQVKAHRCVPAGELRLPGGIVHGIDLQPDPDIGQLARHGSGMGE